MRVIIFFIIVLIYSGCSKQEKLTCSSLENDYKRFHYLKENNERIPINTIEGQANKSASREIFLYDLKEEFKNNVSQYMRTQFYNYTLGHTEIIKPYLNRYCHQMNFIMQHDTNQTIVKGKFKKLEQEWVKSYKRIL